MQHRTIGVKGLEGKDLRASDPHHKVQMRETETDGELFTELSSYSVMRVDASIRRPPPSPLDQAICTSQT